MLDKAAIATNRFGLGARPWESPPADPRGWVEAQFARWQPALIKADTLASRADLVNDILEYRQAIAGQRKNPDAKAQNQAERAETRDYARGQYLAQVGARMHNAVAGDAPFGERLSAFWANHFAVSADKLELIGLAGQMEFEAIRPHVFGRFEDMLLAVEQHPAMLLYLDQAQSVGPTSALGTRASARGRKVGLNENLGREAMELHTLGVRTGYTQADVTEFARALTGWTVAGLGRGPMARGAAADVVPGSFVFADAMHEPGARTIMGKRYDQPGEAQARAVLADLARSPATAHHLSFKLARHFVADDPPAALVARMEAAYLSSHGDLPAVYRAMLSSPEAWESAPAKFRDPWLWTVASLRAVSGPGGTLAAPMPDKALAGALGQLGQPVWRPGSPAGFDDIAASWAAPDALMRRVELAGRLSAMGGPELDARTLADKLFGPGLSTPTRTSVARAETSRQGLSLLLVSPEMLRC